jgi:hypothetical protein
VIAVSRGAPDPGPCREEGGGGASALLESCGFGRHPHGANRSVSKPDQVGGQMSTWVFATYFDEDPGVQSVLRIRGPTRVRSLPDDACPGSDPPGIDQHVAGAQLATGWGSFTQTWRCALPPIMGPPRDSEVPRRSMCTPGAAASATVITHLNLGISPPR